MGTIQEVAERLDAAKQSALESKALVAASRDTAEDLIGLFHSLGMESRAVPQLEQAEARLREVVDRYEHVAGLIEAARFLVASAEHGMTGGGPKGDAAASAGDSTGDRPASASETAEPPHVEGTVAHMGEPLTAPEAGPGPFRKELASADDSDNTQSKLGRLGRVAVRGAGDLKDYGSDLAKSSNTTIASFDPPDTGSYTAHTEVPQPIPQIHSATPHVDPSDVVGNAMVMGVAVFEGVVRLFRRRKRRKHGR